jgi:hypothetical protein
MSRAENDLYARMISVRARRGGSQTRPYDHPLGSETRLYIITNAFNIHLDEWIIMPNHSHGIFWIQDSGKGEVGGSETRPYNHI